MLFSLIVGSVERTAPLSRLLASLAAQSERDFEVILVDQNGDERLAPLADIWSEAGMRLRRIRAARGLSHARNAGLAVAGGELVAFPDDDCWYPTTLLATVAVWFAAHAELAGLTGRTVAPGGEPTCGRWAPAAAEISRRRVFRQGNSASLFLRRAAVAAVGGFDEQLGLGADSPWWAGEETDYLLRLLEHGFRLQYVPSLEIFHLPQLLTAAEKVRRSGRGMGRVMRRHHMGVAAATLFCARPLLGAAWKGVTAQPAVARYYLHSFLGRVEGLLGRCLAS
jgi:glycosyltransferase involved in cell wall biosynthesis